jgi:antitoxin VapB
MGKIETKTFKSGNSVAVRLPKELGFPPDVAVTLEKIGDTVRIRAIDDIEEGKLRVSRLIAALEAIGTVGEIGERLPIDVPERPSLI